MSGVEEAVAIASLATGAIGTAVSVSAQQANASAQANQANYASEVAQNNAILANRAATTVQQQGAQQQEQQAVQGQQLISREKAVLASNGVDATSGSALNITNSQAKQNELDSETIGYNANNQALQFEAEGDNFNASAANDLLAASNDLSAGTTGSIATALSGAGSVASKWYQFNQQGAFNSSNSVNASMIGGYDTSGDAY